MHACLVAVAEELLAVAEDLLEVDEVLLLGQFAFGVWRVICGAHRVFAVPGICGHSCSVGAGRPVQYPCA